MFVTSQCLLSLFVATIIFTGLCSGACDVGWLQNGDYCYFISNSSDVGSLTQAAHQCFLMDAQLARPDTKEELNFLQTTIKDTNGYGWMINFFVEDPQMRYFDSVSGATVTTNDIPFYSFYNTIQNNFKQFTPAFGSIPEVSPDYDADANHDGHCIAFHIPDIIEKSEPWFEEVSCSLPLHVVCQINKTFSPNQVVDSLVWFERKGMLYWLGDDLVNFDDAKRTCKDKNMNLLDNIDRHAANFFLETTSISDAVPIWSAATFSYSGLKWLTGEDVQVSEARYWGNKYVSKRAGTVLLNTGYVQLFDMDYRWMNLAAFPYICKKMNHLANKFDCPDHWTRAGRSCYYYTASYKTTWQKANDFCQERDSHLLKIDSVDEIIWLTESLKPLFVSSCQWHDCDYVWTSATDKDKEGSFTWHDGSKIDDVIFPWRTDIYSDQTTKRCVIVNMKYQYFYPVSCDYTYRPACQYPLPDIKSMCANNWFQYNGTCYYLDLEGTMVPKDLNIATCRSKLEGSDVSSWMVKELEIRSQEQFDYLTKAAYSSFSNPGPALWLSLEARDVIGQYTWKDGTVQDMTKWKAPDRSYNDDSPKHCVGADVNFQGNKRSCDNELYYVCEKELSSFTDAASFRGVPAIVFIVTLALMACRVGDFVVSG